MAGIPWVMLSLSLNGLVLPPHSLEDSVIRVRPRFMSVGTGLHISCAHVIPSHPTS